MNRAIERIGLVLLGGALALAGERVLLSPDSPDGDGRSIPVPDADVRDAIRQRQMDLAEDRLRTDLRLALTGFFRLVEFRDFARAGAAVTVLVPTGEATGRAGVIASGARGVRVPRILIEPEARREWAELGQRLEGVGDGVDARVFEAFEAVRAFVAEHPLPQAVDYPTVAGSEWSGAAVVERWLALNRTLASRAVAALSQVDAGP